MNKAWIGIDTSNYTTSASAFLDNGKFYSSKIPLCVKPNEKGVRQSDAVFMHVKNLPIVMGKLFDQIFADNTKISISAVGVSTRPRPVEGSYMPCFLSGVSVARSIACCNNVPIYEFSHQEGHIRAALLGANLDIPEHFYSFHLSGGTCELLDVWRKEFGFTESIIAESADITLGQLVDRAGVMLGLQFPCGPELESCAQKSDKKFNVKITGDRAINLSGFENKVAKMIDCGDKREDISRYVYSVISSAVHRMLECRTDNVIPVIFAGGVSGSKILKSELSLLDNAYFAPPELASDNAVGIALLTKEKFLGTN